MHTGSGDQHNIHNYYYEAIRNSVNAESARRNARRVAVDELRRLKQRFIAPAGTERARLVLERRSALLVSAAPGDGARSTAEMLLCEPARAAEHFRELVDQAEEDETGRALAPEAVEDDAALLLDLSSTADERCRVFMENLPSFLATVREHRARLAVVIPPDRPELLNPRLRDLFVPLGRPDEHLVLRRHLLVHDIRPSSGELTDERLPPFLAAASMSEIAALAEEILLVRDAAGDRSGFAVWLDAALTAMEPGAGQVDKEIARLESGEQRALLLTTALLHGARPDTIHEATAQLLTSIGHPHVNWPLLQQATLSAQLDDIGAATRPNGRVRFGRPKYDEAVRAYFWDNFPPLRPQLRAWIGCATAFPALGRDDLLTLVSRYAEQCLRTGPPESLSSLAHDWTRSSAPQTELSMAARALGDGVQHPQYGSHFRSRIYHWSRESSTPVPRAHVLIGVCSEALPVHFPDQAVTRLLHLSRHPDEGVQHTACDALLHITSSDNRLWCRLLERVTDSLTGSAGERDVGLYLRLADPVRLMESAAHDRPLLTNARVRALLIDCWEVVLHQRQPHLWEPCATRWLAAASGSSRHRDRLLDILLEACGRDVAALSRLHVVTRDWAAGHRAEQHPDREDPSARVARLFGAKLRVALGLDPATARTP